MAAGRAPPGSVLPSVRALAAELGVATGTVAAAYRLLAGRGIVEGHRRAGTRVRRPVDVRRRGTAVPLGLRDLATGNPDPALLPDLGQALTKATATNGDGRGPCGLLAEPAGPPAKVVQPTSLPVTPPASPSANAPTSSTGGRLYGGAAVLPALESWARRSFEADGIILEGLTVASGALDAVQRALEVHLRPGARVAVEDPGYAGLLDLLGVLGLVAEPVRVDADGMVATALGTALARGAQAVVLTPRAQNPTGAALTPARARALQDVCRRAPDVLVVEDDHAGPVSGAPAVTVVGGSSGRGRRVVVVRSFSKSLGPDLRLAMVAADLHTVAAIEARQSVGAGWVSHLLQATALGWCQTPGSPLASSGRGRCTASGARRSWRAWPTSVQRPQDGRGSMSGCPWPTRTAWSPEWRLGDGPLPRVRGTGWRAHRLCGSRPQRSAQTWPRRSPPTWSPRWHRRVTTAPVSAKGH